MVVLFGVYFFVECVVDFGVYGCLVFRFDNMIQL